MLLYTKLDPLWVEKSFNNSCRNYFRIYSLPVFVISFKKISNQYLQRILQFFQEFLQRILQKICFSSFFSGSFKNTSTIYFCRKFLRIFGALMPSDIVYDVLLSVPSEVSPKKNSKQSFGKSSRDPSDMLWGTSSSIPVPFTAIIADIL